MVASSASSTLTRRSAANPGCRPASPRTSSVAYPAPPPPPPPLRTTPPAPRTAPRSGWSGRTHSCRSRTGAGPARRSCTARDTSRRAAPRARGARSPAGASRVLLGQTVDECLEVIRCGAPLVGAPVHEKAGRALHAARFTFLHTGLDAAGIALAVHAGVVLVEIETDAPGEIAEQAARVLPGLGPLVIGEQLVVHLPELALLPGALSRERGIAGVGVRGEGKIAIAPPHLARGDQLLADHGHLHRRERRAEGALEVRILRDLDPRRVRPHRVPPEPVRRRDRNGPARPPPRPKEKRDHPLPPPGPPPVSPPSPTPTPPGPARPCRSASSTTRRLSATS